MNDFTPEKLIDLMKKNGEWDEEDEEQYGAEAQRNMQENPEDGEEDMGPPPQEILNEKGEID